MTFRTMKTPLLPISKESDIQLKETTMKEIEEIRGQLTIWDILQKDAFASVHTVEFNQAV